MTALHHFGHANEGTSVMAFEAHLNYQSAGNLHLELIGIFCFFNLLPDVHLKLQIVQAEHSQSCRREVVYRRRQGCLSKLSLKALLGRGPVLKVQVFGLISDENF